MSDASKLSGLLIVGENLDRHTAFRWAEQGKVVQLVRGIYATAEADIDHLVPAHALRIAHHLYPRAYLAGASARRMTMTAGGKLYLSGRRNQRTRIRGLEIVQNVASASPSLVSIRTADALGEFTMSASSPEQQLLESLRLRSEHAAGFTDLERLELASELVLRHGTEDRALAALWAVAKANGWHREYLEAMQVIGRGPAPVMIRNVAAFDLLVDWHGTRAGQLSHDGAAWRWRADPLLQPNPMRETIPGKLPAFIESLLPEGWLAKALRTSDPRDVLRSGHRYMSNIAIAVDESTLAATPPDVVTSPLGLWMGHGEFSGSYQGPGGESIREEFSHRVAALVQRPDTPRLSGVQLKVAMHLVDGVLWPVTGERPFTHILKPGGTSGLDMLGVVEWACLRLAAGAGFDVPAHALVNIGPRHPPALLVERFDIRLDASDRRRLALEDFCSVLDVPSADKYSATIEQVARALRPLSTDPTADLETLFRRAVFAWIVADGDMHLKNLALLKIASADSTRFDQVRLAPVYDAVTTRVFPGMANDHMALKLNGRDDRLGMTDFLRLAATIQLSLDRARAMIDSLRQNVGAALGQIILPPVAARHEQAPPILLRLRNLVCERIAALD